MLNGDSVISAGKAGIANGFRANKDGGVFWKNVKLTTDNNATREGGTSC